MRALAGDPPPPPATARRQQNDVGIAIAEAAFIYKIEGDILTICAVPSTNPADRPKEFKTAPDSKALILTLKKD